MGNCMKKRTLPIYLGGIDYTDHHLQIFVVKKYSSSINTVFYLMPLTSEQLISACTTRSTYALHGQPTYAFTFEELARRPLSHLRREMFFSI